MAGFRIDPEALEAAIRKLEDARDQAFNMTRSVQSAMPGELTAKDTITSGARELFRDRANGADASLQGAAMAIHDKLNAKIEAYRDTLNEYRLAEDNASVDASRVDGRS